MYDWLEKLNPRHCAGETGAEKSAESDRFARMCDWWKLYGYGWVSLLRVRPEFASHCDWETLDANCWVRLLSARPEFASHCDWKMLAGNDWVELLSVRPEFASHCNWEMLTGNDWVELLRVRPVGHGVPLPGRPRGTEQGRDRPPDRP